MKPRVLVSHEDPNGTTCVDILAFPDGRFGYAMFRRDPEDGHGWRNTGAPDGPRFATRAEAEQAARDLAPWV